MKYFTIDELTHSNTASAKVIDNRPNSVESANLLLLVENVLDPLREAYGKPITVTSGFRSSALNKTVGGVTGSQHMKGQAADITAGTKEANKVLFDLAIDLDLPFDQLIDEKDYSWVHISFNKNGNRKQVLHL